MVVIALDVGTRRIGVAVSAPFGGFALPLAPIVRTNIEADLAAVVSLLDERAVTTLVIGDPRSLSGERGIASTNMDRFVERLARHWSGKIERVDERLTTAQAQRTLLDADVSRTKRKGLIDGMAAALILETYLRRASAEG